MLFTTQKSWTAKRHAVAVAAVLLCICTLTLIYVGGVSVPTLTYACSPTTTTPQIQPPPQSGLYSDGENNSGYDVLTFETSLVNIATKCFNLTCLNTTLHFRNKNIFVPKENTDIMACLDIKCISVVANKTNSKNHTMDVAETQLAHPLVTSAKQNKTEAKTEKRQPTTASTYTLATPTNTNVDISHKAENLSTPFQPQNTTVVKKEKTNFQGLNQTKNETFVGGGRIAIVTAVGKSTQGAHFNVEDTYSKIVSYALTNYNVYAQRHGYAVFSINSHMADPSRKFYWAKIPIIRHYLDLGFEWVFWTDIDWLFLNTSAPIESLIVPGKDIITSRECFNEGLFKAMSGTMLLKNTRITRHMLDVWDGMYAQYKDNHNPEQDAFEVLMGVNGSFAQHHHNHNASDFMTYHYCHGPARGMIAQGGHFGIHFPGPDKVGVMHEYYSEWLQTLPENERPAQYLNMIFTPLQ